MIWIAILLVLGVIPLLVIIFMKGRDSGRRRKPDKPTMLYAPGSTDIAAEAYHSPRKDSTMPFPLGKKKERKKTETFRQSSEDD